MASLVCLSISAAFSRPMCSLTRPNTLLTNRTQSLQYITTLTSIFNGTGSTISQMREQLFLSRLRRGAARRLSTFGSWLRAAGAASISSISATVRSLSTTRSSSWPRRSNPNSSRTWKVPMQKSSSLITPQDHAYDLVVALVTGPSSGPVHMMSRQEKSQCVYKVKGGTKCAEWISLWSDWG